MTTWKRVVLGLFLAYGVLVVTTAAVAAAFLVHDGIMTVRVHEKGRDGAHFTIPVPGSALRLAMFLADRALPARDRAQLRREVAREIDQLPSALAAIARELENCPDVTLVDVQDHNDHITIEKRGGTLYLHVDDPNTAVRVSVPASMVSLALETLGEIAG